MYVRQYEGLNSHEFDHILVYDQPIDNRLIEFNTSKFNVPQYGTSYYSSLDLPDCAFKSPFDDTKCLISDKSWSLIKWSGIALFALFMASKAAPLAVDIKKTLSKK